MDQNLARQAEIAFERQGDYETLCYEGAWHTSGQMADRGSRLATGLAWACGPATGCVLVPGSAFAAEAAPGVPVLDFYQVASAEPGSIADRSGTDLAALLYTGGTTGLAKGCMITHANLYANVRQCTAMLPGMGEERETFLGVAAPYSPTSMASTVFGSTCAPPWAPRRFRSLGAHVCPGDVAEDHPQGAPAHGVSGRALGVGHPRSCRAKNVGSLRPFVHQVLRVRLRAAWPVGLGSSSSR